MSRSSLCKIGACIRLTTGLLSEVAATLAVGQRLKGKVGSYKVVEQFTKDRAVWKATPANVPFDDEHYGFWVLVEQVRRFGSFNDSFEEIADAERLAICTGAIVYIQENQKWLPFSISEDGELARPDKDFIAKMMKLDPRDRPTARELLQDA
ncbi:MAG: hypothetical protein Q9181_002705, partial [Wetmoreana brouardii]